MAALIHDKDGGAAQAVKALANDALRRWGTRDEPLSMVNKVIVFGGRRTLVSYYELDTGLHSIEYFDTNCYKTYWVNLCETDTEWSEDFDARLGARVEIYWELDDKWYSGIVDRQRGNFPGVLELRVKYNDGKYMWHPFYGKPFTGHGAPPPAADDDPVQWRFV